MFILAPCVILHLSKYDLCSHSRSRSSARSGSGDRSRSRLRSRSNSRSRSRSSSSRVSLQKSPKRLVLPHNMCKIMLVTICYFDNRPRPFVDSICKCFATSKVTAAFWHLPGPILVLERKHAKCLHATNFIFFVFQGLLQQVPHQAFC